MRLLDSFRWARRAASRAAVPAALLWALLGAAGGLQGQAPAARPAAQEPQEQPAPAVPPATDVDPAPAEVPAPEAAPDPATRRRGAIPEAALEEIERALDEVEERMEDEAEAAEDAADGVALRERRERVREVREQVRRRLREHSDRSDNKVSFGSSIRIAEGEVARDVVAIGGTVTVDGDVYGDVVAVGGSVSIDGRVTGAVVAVGGGVHLGEEAEVLGEITSVGGKVVRAEGAEVMGRINEVAFGPNFTWQFGDTDIHWWDWTGHRRGWSPFRFEWFGFALSLTGVVVLLLLACLVRLVAGRTVERVRAKAVESPWLCGLVGLAVELFFVPVLVVVTLILCISIIGIPLLLLLPFVLLAFVVALIVGYTGSALAVGEWTARRFNWSTASPYVAIAIGVLSIQILHVTGELFDSFDGFLWVFAVMFGVVGFLVRYVAWTVGLGAVFLTAVRSPNRAAMAVPPPPTGLPPSGGDYPPPPPPAQPGAPEWSGQPMDDRDPAR